MKKAFVVALGLVTAIGGFVDIGNIVTSGVTGARFSMSLVWAIVVGTIGMTVYAEMAGRVTAVAQRPVFHVVRERLGVRFGLFNLIACCILNLLTLAAEVGGVGLALELASDVNYLLWVPLIALAMWGVIWRLPFKAIEQVFGVVGLSLLVFVLALFWLPTDWGALATSTFHPSVPPNEAYTTYFFYAASLIGACLVPYQIIFFSSGGIEEQWTTKSMLQMRLNTIVGFPLGGLLSIAIVATSAVVLQPLGADAGHLSQVGLPAAIAFGKVGLAFALVGFFAATFVAGAESTMSTGYAVAQYFGWSWGKWHKPSAAPQFHVICLLTLIAGTLFTLTTIDPVTLTIVSVVLGAVAIPLTFLPVLVVANDRDYLGDRVNGTFANIMGVAFLGVIGVVSIVTLPLLFWTRGGS
ncbi:MAG TPA: divalent metal cation transporter [Flexivirga sp.]|uniref:NRAMP family divalent metal transporter n=1 Tax=Flexivirga sp. TaxID=1962927 RepID=UPI002B7938E6|nr:divalent metal cation transporter [Flexivirga sp.]HWC21748.1 divalent metal cation transporter [Flexivirga sp.]